jgi:hypothetical protein
MQEISATQGEVDEKEAKVRMHDEELHSMQSKLTEISRCKAQLAGKQRAQSIELKKAERLPEKATTHLEQAMLMHTQVQKQHALVAQQLEEKDGIMQRKQQALRNIGDEYSLMVGEVERRTYAVEAWEQNIDNMQKEFSMKQLEAEQILGHHVRLHLAAPPCGWLRLCRVGGARLSIRDTGAGTSEGTASDLGMVWVVRCVAACSGQNSGPVVLVRCNPVFPRQNVRCRQSWTYICG